MTTVYKLSLVYRTILIPKNIDHNEKIKEQSPDTTPTLEAIK